MRMNTCLETSSPRISYSLEYGQSDFIPVELSLPPLPPSSNPGFEFGTRGDFEFGQSSADELFQNGMILPSPVQMRQGSRCEEQDQEREARPQPLPFLSPLHVCPSSHGDELEEAMEQTEEENEIPGSNSKPDEKIQPRTLWGFRRSTSLDSGNGKVMSFLLPLPVLSRSNPASSGPRNPKRRPLQKQHPSVPRMAKSSSLPGYACSIPRGGTYYGSSIKVAPVLNIPNCCTTSGTVNLFGLGCLSLGGKEKKCSG